MVALRTLAQCLLLQLLLHTMSSYAAPQPTTHAAMVPSAIASSLRRKLFASWTVPTGCDVRLPRTALETRPRPTQCNAEGYKESG